MNATVPQEHKAVQTMQNQCILGLGSIHVLKVGRIFNACVAQLCMAHEQRSTFFQEYRLTWMQEIKKKIR